MKIKIVGSTATILSHHLKWKEKTNYNLYQILCVTKECNRDTGSENTVLRTVLKIIIKMKKNAILRAEKKKKIRKDPKGEFREYIVCTMIEMQLRTFIVTY